MFPDSQSLEKIEPQFANLEKPGEETTFLYQSLQICSQSFSTALNSILPQNIPIYSTTIFPLGTISKSFLIRHLHFFDRETLSTCLVQTWPKLFVIVHRTNFLLLLLLLRFLLTFVASRLPLLV
jgi:hypothetical protein